MAAGLLELGQAFLVCAVAGAVALRIGLSVIPLYVVGGMLAGPFVAGRAGLPAVSDGELLTVLAEVGIVLLLFFLGLEFSLDRLLAARSKVTRAGVIDVAVNLPLGIVIGLALGWSAVEALLLGGIVSSAVSTFKRSIPFQYGIWGPRFGSKVIAVNTALKIVFIAIALAALLVPT